jgi:hypothetical protein
MTSLDEIVKNTVFWYAAGGTNLLTFPLANEARRVYAVNIIDVPYSGRPAGVVVMARVLGDTVIIEADTTDRPLVDALVANGVPRDKIVLAYAGEPSPEG